MKRIFLFCWLLAAVTIAQISRADSVPLAGAELRAFQQDLDLLATELSARHARIDHHTPRVQFVVAVEKLRARLPQMTRTAAIVALTRLVALARDGHTALFLLPFPGLPKIEGIRPLPVQFYGFEDGWRIVAIAREHRALLGARLLGIGGVDITQLEQDLAQLVPQDNAMGVREYVAWYLAMREVLMASGAAADSGPVEFQLETPAGKQTLKLDSLASGPDASWISHLLTLPLPRGQWVAAGEEAQTPLWLSQPETPYWFKQTADDEVYAQINQMREATPGEFAAFVERLLAAVPASGKPRLILDLRLNRGGNGELSWPLIYALIRAERVNQPGQLYVLTGRRTFSAAQLLANALDKHTHAIFVGEPTGSSPNHYGELGQLQLPQTGLTVFYSQLYWQADPRDSRPWIAPELAAPLNYADLAAGVDPALRAIREYQPPAAPAAVMDNLLLSGDGDAAVQAFRQMAARYPNPWGRPFEKPLNDYGYALLGKRNADALVVFKLATELYPEAPNAWDSLGEAHYAVGERARAAYCYGRTLRLKPADPHASDMLAKILGAP